MQIPHLRQRTRLSQQRDVQLGSEKFRLPGSFVGAVPVLDYGFPVLVLVDCGGEGLEKVEGDFMEAFVD